VASIILKKFDYEKAWKVFLLSIMIVDGMILGVVKMGVGPQLN
jgi:hypothetical protein